jgi:D-alanyl-lipoteichoic acid acyltransferase DltB (MBOAT superfamily)
MTMSRFFRDYVYIGLGGNRYGMTRSLLNIAITTTLSGLWHGAGWTFVTWGWVHGAYIVVFQLWRKWKRSHGLEQPTPSLVTILPAWILTQLAISLSRILFRSSDFGTAWTYAKGLLGSPGIAHLDLQPLVLLAFAAVLADHVAGWSMERWPTMNTRIPVFAKALVNAGMIVLLFTSRPDTVKPYVYFQF